MNTEPAAAPVPKKRIRFFLASLGVGALGLLSLFSAAAVFLSHLLFHYDIVDFSAVPMLLVGGVWIHAFAALAALVGLFVRAERRLLCVLALALNLTPALVAVGIFAAGLILIG